MMVKPVMRSNLKMKRVIKMVFAVRRLIVRVSTRRML